MKKMMKRLVIELMLTMMLLAGMGAKEVQAAPLSYNKAVSLYNKAIASWGRCGATTTITGDLRVNGFYDFYSIAGNRISMRSLYYSDDVRFIFKNIGGDSTVEAIFYSGGYVYIFNIQKNKVRLLAVIYGGDFGVPEFYYNAKKHTFALRTMVTGRSTSTMVYALKNNRIYRYYTLGDYIGQMEPNGYMPKEYLINDKKVSSSTYRKYTKTYSTGLRQTHWAP